MILAIELSSYQGGIALLNGVAIRGERVWRDATARHTSFWPAMQALAAETRLEWEAVSMFAVGRGPGSYSGLRAALTAAAMLTAPGGQPVYAVSSGAVMAAEWFASNAARGERAVVAGDARRGAVWHALFERDAGAAQQVCDWSLCAASEFAKRVPTGAPVLTSEWERMARILGHYLSFDLVEQYPSAAGLARLARDRWARGVPSEPAEPLYLHPPV